MNVIKLFEFKDNNKNYIVYLKDKVLLFGYEVDNQIKNDLSNDELINIRSIYNLLVGSKENLIKLSSSKINNSLIAFFYNPNNHLYSFFEEKNNTYIKPSKNILVNLNLLFNNHEGILYDKNDENKSNDVYKIIIKKGSKVIVVFVLASLVLSYLPSMPANKTLFKIDYALDNMYKDPNLVYDNTSYSFDSVKEVIDSNDNLTDEEKIFLYGMKKEIDENIDYIDIDKLKNNLANLSIKYNSAYKDSKNKQDVLINYNVLGSYTYMGINKGSIDLYDSMFYHSTSLEDANKATLIHELNHVLNNKPNLLSISGYQGNVVGKAYSVFDVEGNVLNEMVNELFAREYSTNFANNDDFNGYDDLMPVMYALAEIIDEDTLRRYKFNSDDYYINNYFKSIGVEENYVYSLYKDLNLSYSACLTEEEKKNNNQEIYNIIKYMYEKKYGVNMENDLLMMSYFYHSNYATSKLNKQFEEIVNVDDIVVVRPKGYFSSDYINQHQTVDIYKYAENADEIFVKIYSIDDENRFIDNKKTK